MRNVPSDAIFNEAADWLIEIRDGALDARDLVRFNAWLRRSPENIDAYLEAAAIWEEIPLLAGDMDIDVDAIVEHARAQSNITEIGRYTPQPAAETAEAARKSTPRHWSWPYAAAIALLAVLVSVVTLGLWPASSELYSTAIGEQRSIVLADGSVVRLDARSAVRVELLEHERRVELLAGQAVFSVAKDQRRPFVVSSNNTQVRAVGTEFNVHKMRSRMTVTVLEGKVAVVPNAAQLSAADAHDRSGRSPSVEAVSSEPNSHTTSGSGPIYVSAGQALTISMSDSEEVSGDRAIDVALTAVDEKTLMKSEQTLTFDNVSILDVIDEFNRYNPRQIAITGDALQSVRITGVFSATKPESLLRFLSEQMGFEVATTQSGYTVKKLSQAK
jgi:transmembrane sensor